MNILKGDFIESETNTYNKELLKFPYECDHFQKHSFKCIDEGSNVLITAHTGSGKTVVAMYAIAHAIKNNKKVVYTSPIKSLSNEKYKDFRERFGDKFKEETGLDVSIGLLTGDNKINPDGNLLIMTAEILRNSLFKTKMVDTETKDFIEDLGCIIMDEVHFINDHDRGKVWEETIVLAPQDIQLVMLSATIDKAEEFASWISKIREKKIYLIPTTHRVVPLDHYIYISNNIHKIMDTKDNYIYSGYKSALAVYAKKQKDKEKINMNLIQEIVRYLKDNDLLQTIFFSFSRKNCETYANIVNTELITDGEFREISRIWSKYLEKDEVKYLPLEQYNTLKKLVHSGVAFHHSGLIPILKEIVEILFQKGLIKILFATETFAVGVNMPTRSVVFTELEKYTNRGKRFLNTAEYKQMSGRAGRRGIDTVGYSILLPLYNFPDEDDLKSVLTGKMPKIESKFNIDYQFVLKAMINKMLDNNLIVNKSLKEQEKVVIRASLLKDLENAKAEFAKFTNIEEKLESKEKDVVKVKTMIELEKKLKNYSSMGLMITLSKKESKDYQTIQNEMKKNEQIKKLYQEVSKYYEVQETCKRIENNLQLLSDENNIVISNICEILKEMNYLNEDNVPLQKGVISSQINECNPIIFTEMIMSGMFDDISEIDIVSLLSIFVEDRTDEEVFKSDLTYSFHLLDKVKEVETVIDKFIQLENKYLQHSQTDFWKTSIGSMDATYLWASGQHISKLKNDGLIGYEGNFIRNMTKLYNITNDVMNVCKTIGKVELLPKLEKIPPLIIRDIVNISSLYFIQ